MKILNITIKFIPELYLIAALETSMFADKLSYYCNYNCFDSPTYFAK